MSNSVEHDLILREAAKIVDGLARTFAPFCEVVLHDLRNPEHAIIKIENNLSGRAVGDPATELGLARIADGDVPDLIANYANAFSDGRSAKSTSIGLRDSEGAYVAAICLNMDVSYFRSVSDYLLNLTKTDDEMKVAESLGRSVRFDLEGEVRAFASKRNKDPRALSSQEKRDLIQHLHGMGGLDQRGAADKLAGMIATSRSSIYYYLNKKD